jgi:uncharacterized protein YjgD (DUF1641 family)
MTTATEQLSMGDEARRFGEAARDALTDEMVVRLTQTATDAMDLIDRVNRTGLAKAIPALASMVNNGDLDRLVQLARVYGSAEDALTDEMVGRLSETMVEGLSLLDRLNRGGAGRLVELLARLEAAGSMQRIADALPRLVEKLDTVERMLQSCEHAATTTAAGPRSKGGFGGIWQLMSDADNQDALRFLINVGKELCASGQSVKR